MEQSESVIKKSENKSLGSPSVVLTDPNDSSSAVVISPFIDLEKMEPAQKEEVIAITKEQQSVDQVLKENCDPSFYDLTKSNLAAAAESIILDPDNASLTLAQKKELINSFSDEGAITCWSKKRIR